MISVIIPTVRGREEHLRRCIEAYERFTPAFELIVVHDKPSCGEAWAEGGEKASGDFLHFSADDLEPHQGWWEAAVACVGDGKLPCPRILGPSGKLESCGEWGTEVEDGSETNIARIPFLSREMWAQGGWILPIHYYTDNHIWLRGRQLGIPTVVCRDYLFTHHWAQAGRKNSIDEDFQAYVAAGGSF